MIERLVRELIRSGGIPLKTRGGPSQYSGDVVGCFDTSSCWQAKGRPDVSALFS